MTWKKGESGNPAGRPKGTRHKLSDAVRTLLLATSALLRKRYGPKGAAQVLRDAAEQIEKPLLQVVE